MAIATGAGTDEAESPFLPDVLAISHTQMTRITVQSGSVGVGDGVGVGVGVSVGVGVAVAVGVGMGVAVGVWVGDGVWAAVGVGVADGNGVVSTVDDSAGGTEAAGSGTVGSAAG